MNGKTAKLIRKSLGYQETEKVQFTVPVHSRVKRMVETNGKSKLTTFIETRKVKVPRVHPELRGNYQQLKDSYNMLPRTERAQAKASMQRLMAG